MRVVIWLNSEDIIFFDWSHIPREGDFVRHPDEEEDGDGHLLKVRRVVWLPSYEDSDASEVWLYCQRIGGFEDDDLEELTMMPDIEDDDS